MAEREQQCMVKWRQKIVQKAEVNPRSFYQVCHRCGIGHQKFY